MPTILGKIAADEERFQSFSWAKFVDHTRILAWMDQILISGSKDEIVFFILKDEIVTRLKTLDMLGSTTIKFLCDSKLNTNTHLTGHAEPEHEKYSVQGTS